MRIRGIKMRSDYLEFFKSDNTVIETPRLRLRKMSRRDKNDMYEYASRDSVTKYLLWRTHPDIEHTKRYLDYITTLYKSGDFFDFAVEYRENSKMIGTCGFASIDAANNSAEVGYVLSPDYWGQGIATEALTALLRFAFCDMKLNRVEARYMTENIASRRVMEKCGMTFEGVMRKKLLVKGSYRDIGVCSILSEEYFANNREGTALSKISGNFLGIRWIKKK